MTTLEQALGEVETPEPEVVVEVETGAADEPEVDVKADAEPETLGESKKDDLPPKSETPAETTVPIAAMHGERDRRQLAEQKLTDYMAAHPETPVEKTSVLVDEDKAFEERNQDTQTYVKNTLLEAGKAEAVLQHDQATVDTAEAWFLESIQERPLLLEELRGVSPMQQHRKIVILHQEHITKSAQNENPAEYATKLKAEGVKEYLEQQKADTDKKKAVTDSIPKSLVGDLSDGALSGSDWSGPTPLDSALSEGG